MTTLSRLLRVAVLPVLRYAGGTPEMNADTSAQTAPRHQKTTDPLVLDCSVLAERKGYDDASAGMQCHWTRVFKVPDGNWLRDKKK